jgi:hypothetical protein
MLGGWCWAFCTEDGEASTTGRRAGGCPLSQRLARYTAAAMTSRITTMLMVRPSAALTDRAGDGCKALFHTSQAAVGR